MGGQFGRFTGRDAELKYLDTTLSIAFPQALTASTTAGTGGVNLIPQNSTASGRTGRLVVLKSIQLRGFVQMAASALDDSTCAVMAYLWLVLDTQANGAYPTAANVFTGTVGASCLQNIDNSQRFKVLKKFVFPMIPAAGAATLWNNTMKPVSFYTKCSIPIDIDNTDGAIGGIRTNNVCMVFGTDGNLATAPCTFSGNCRVRYSDS